MEWKSLISCLLCFRIIGHFESVLLPFWLQHKHIFFSLVVVVMLQAQCKSIVTIHHFFFFSHFIWNCLSHRFNMKLVFINSIHFQTIYSIQMEHEFSHFIQVNWTIRSAMTWRMNTSVFSSICVSKVEWLKSHIDKSKYFLF